MDYLRAKPSKATEHLLFTIIANSRVTELLRMIKENEVDLNCENINGTRPIHSACKYKLDTIVKILLENGADPNSQEAIEVGEKSALHLAVENDAYEIARMLLDYGASPNITDRLDQTPLHVAAQNGFLDICELLQNYGADGNLRDGNGFNAAYWAKLHGHDDVLEVLPKVSSLTTKQFAQRREQVEEVLRERGYIAVDRRKKKKKKKKR